METQNINESENIVNTEPVMASGSGTNNTETTGKKGKEVINLVEELDSLIQNKQQIAKKNLLLQILADNKLFWIKDKEQEKHELAQKFEGLDRIMFDKLATKAGEIQHSVVLNIYNHVSNSIIGIFPFTGTAYSNMANAVVDNLKKIIERSFSVSEVREIVAKYEAEIQKKLLVIRNYMSEEQKKDDKIADLEKQLREAKDEIAVLKQQIEIQINNQELQAQIQIPPK